MSAEIITIHYKRLPNRLQLFEQVRLDHTAERTVTFLEAAAVKRPVMAGERVILEPGAPVVWFTYPDRWHDIGRFHLADGTFTGIYANILTPVAMDGGRWETTDLCLDVWLGADGSSAILDEDELEEALTNGWIDAETAERARQEAQRLLSEAVADQWPPAEVNHWTLERARARLEKLSG